MNQPKETPTSHHASQALFDLAMADEETLDEMDPAEIPSPETPGLIIAGRYILKSLLGEGGAGKVWCAEQTQPVKREVAIKIIRPGLLAKPVSARFSREHQVLARMEHPNIAAIFDAGELPDGRTYFVMEVVVGEAVTRWCRHHESSIPEKLDIFIQACMAVQHAHQKGILHRDLKPSNVMVTQVDGRPMVKVIDFGIAKALATDLSPGIDATLYGMIVGTPRYMSPEQADLSGVELDARADVYVLGVLLYELLTGNPPIRHSAGKEPPLAELLQRVRQDEIEPPSRRVISTTDIEPSIAKSWSRDLQGELDWICLRALQKDREQRYPTAQALAEDVQRHMRNEPVSAGPPGVRYRAVKWLKRNRSAISTAAAVILSLSGGLLATWWALEREGTQRQEAKKQLQAALHEADLAKQVSTQLKTLLENARKHAESGMNTQMLRKLADECANGMSRFSNQPKAEAELADQLAKLYLALEEPSRALPWVQRHWELLKITQGAQSQGTLKALYELGWRSFGQGETQKAIMYLREAALGFDALTNTEVKAAFARKELARALSRSGQHEEAVAIMTQAISAKSAKDHVISADWRKDQADVLGAAGRVKEAEAILQQAIDALPNDEANAAKRAYLLRAISRYHKAPDKHDVILAASAQRLRAIENEINPQHPKLLNALIEHALLACRTQDCLGGEEAARRALSMAQKAGHESRLADAWIALSETLRIKRRYQESERAIRDAILEVSQTQAERWRVLELHRRLGDLLTSRRGFEEALSEYEIAAKGWFEGTADARPPENEPLIFTSFIAFWERLADTQSPLADAQQLAEWQHKLQIWKANKKSAAKSQ